MQFRSMLLGLAAAASLAVTASAQLLPPLGGSSSGPQLDPVQLEISQAVASDNSINVVPFEFDPFDMNLSQASWLTGIGCAPDGGTDPLCADGDPKDHRNEGLLLAKTGLSSNVVSAGARINGVQGMTLSVIGYDIRKPLATADPRGSHCGGGAPRFNITVAGVTYFIACNSPVPLQTVLGAGWIRLRWPAALLGPAAAGPVDSISILFDEGQEAGPDNFGLAVLDNITINTQVAGRGPHGGR